MKRMDWWAHFLLTMNQKTRDLSLIEQASATYVSWVTMSIYISLIEAQCHHWAGVTFTTSAKFDWQELILTKR